MSTPLPMTRGRLLALLLGVPIAFALIAWTGLTEVAYAGLGSYPVRLSVPVEGSTVNLSASAADVQVTQAAGSTLRLTGKATYSLIRSNVTWHTTPSGVIVSSRCHFFIGICSFSFHAVLPAGKRTVLSDGSGNLTLRGLTGPVTVGSGSGDVQANVLTGRVSLQSLDVVVTDGSGNVDLTFSKAPTQVKVSNSSGNVNVVLPRGVRYQVNATTDSGNRTVSVLQTTAPGHVITVTDGSGNVSVTY